MKRTLGPRLLLVFLVWLTVVIPVAFAGDVRTGIDVLIANNCRQLAGKRVGLITNHSGFDRTGRRTIDLLASASGVKLVAIFAPEHGIDGNAGAGAAVTDTRDSKTGVPIQSLYGTARRPTAEMLRGSDTLVYDIQDVGVRFYTYIATLGMAMEEAARLGIEVIILDRPNPINGVTVEGPVQDPDRLSFIAYFPMPVRYGMTIGELAAMFNAEKKMRVKLTVIKMENWHRAEWFDQTGLRWVNPSPNLQDLYSVTIHGALNMLNRRDISVGRTTENPYSIFGAPWIDDMRISSYLNGRNLAGVRFIPLRFVPNGDRYAGQECGGAFVHLVDRDQLNTGRVGIELIAALWKLCPDRFDPLAEPTLQRVGSKRVLEAIKRGDDPSQVERIWQPDVRNFRRMRAKYLLYPAP